MPVHHARFEVRTRGAVSTEDVTARVAQAVRGSGVADGIVVVAVLHTTAGLFVNENADPDVQRDLLAALGRIVPDEAAYRHAEGNSPGHVKSVVVGTSLTLPVHEGAPLLGTWQGIFLAELDGPRTRQIAVTVMGEGR